MRVFEEGVRTWNCLAVLSKWQLPFSFGLETNRAICSATADVNLVLCTLIQRDTWCVLTQQPINRSQTEWTCICHCSACGHPPGAVLLQVLPLIQLRLTHSVTVTGADESVQKCPFICKSEISRYESGHFKVGITLKCKPHFPSKHIGVTLVTLPANTECNVPNLLQGTQTGIVTEPGSRLEPIHINISSFFL